MKWFLSEVYSLFVGVYKGPHAGFARYMQRKFGVIITQDGAFASTSLLEHEERGKAVVFWFSPALDLSKPSHQAVVCHEVVHGAFKVLGSLGMVPVDESEEAYAYYQQYLYEALCRRLRH